jgi:hypothetical protein
VSGALVIRVPPRASAELRAAGAALWRDYYANRGGEPLIVRRPRQEPESCDCPEPLRSTGNETPEPSQPRPDGVAPTLSDHQRRIIASAWRSWRVEDLTAELAETAAAHRQALDELFEAVAPLHAAKRRIVARVFPNGVAT